MSECLDPHLGALLHAYGLNALSEEDFKRFEIHLLECEHCFEQLKNFRQVAPLLRSDKEVREMVREAARRQGKSKSFLRKLYHKLWPETPLVLKPAVAYILILLMVVPAYYGLMTLLTKEHTRIQSVYLASDRSVGENVFRIRPEAVVIVNFYVADTAFSDVYRVVIESEDGKEILQQEAFDSFYESEVGSLKLPVSKMHPGDYELIITNPRTGFREKYSFTIKK
ncbi:MAG: zf-HC2 domain-containing protein [Desulfobacteraceae bacterium]|nr:zf-HC2 domain-containing protein [Desulfobacteraceae bacterium]